jgi:hypothetical protein
MELGRRPERSEFAERRLRGKCVVLDYLKIGLIAKLPP